MEPQRTVTKEDFRNAYTELMNQYQDWAETLQPFFDDPFRAGTVLADAVSFLLGQRDLLQAQVRVVHRKLVDQGNTNLCVCHATAQALHKDALNKHGIDMDSNHLVEHLVLSFYPYTQSAADFDGVRMDTIRMAWCGADAQGADDGRPVRAGRAPASQPFPSPDTPTDIRDNRGAVTEDPYVLGRTWSQEGEPMRVMVRLGYTTDEDADFQGVWNAINEGLDISVVVFATCRSGNEPGAEPFHHAAWALMAGYGDAGRYIAAYNTSPVESACAGDYLCVYERNSMDPETGLPWVWPNAEFYTSYKVNARLGGEGGDMTNLKTGVPGLIPMLGQ